MIYLSRQCTTNELIDNILLALNRGMLTFWFGVGRLRLTAYTIIPFIQPEGSDTRTTGVILEGLD